MGVTGLWTVVQPCARPIKIETLNKKRLAVDASIWIYQFLKAVRDKEGNALRNSHVVGFFRRICKLLFIGIKPVFVFDGGAPALKRQTINSRKQRREGRRDDATRTAAKLLALQMQKLAEEEDANRKREAQRGPERDEEEVLPESLVYVDELQMTQQERQQNRKFKKKDQYHLPDLDVSLAEMGAPNDPRIMSLEELEAYARQFDTGEDINVYDFSKIDFDSPFFTSLPASDRYNILNAARLRSRLRMGYSKEQLDAMFPDRMAFSKFQIERVAERNDLTQRLMNLNGMNDDGMFGINGTGRIAGEKGREYILVRNDGVEGGWALGVVGGDEGREHKPIDVEKFGQEEQEEEEEWEEEDEFEDVPIEGLNRLPKLAPTAHAQASSRTNTGASRSVIPGRRRAAIPKQRTALSRPIQEDPESLFVADDEPEAGNTVDEVHGEDAAVEVLSDDDDLQRAIAMSLENENEKNDDDYDQKDWLDTFRQIRAKEGHPLPRGKGLAIAHIVNSRAGKAIPAARSKSPDDAQYTGKSLDLQKTFNTQLPLANVHMESDSSDDEIDFQKVLAESRNDKQQTTNTVVRTEVPGKVAESKPEGGLLRKSGFGGPLPFEKLDLGNSLLGKKKIQKLQEESAGGFERAEEGQKKKPEPLPPWFAGSLDQGMAAQRKIEEDDREKVKRYNDNIQFTELPTLHRHATEEVIDLEALDDDERVEKEAIRIDISDDEEDDAGTNDGAQKLGDVADAVRANPPVLKDAENHMTAKSVLPPIVRPATEPHGEAKSDTGGSKTKTDYNESGDDGDDNDNEPFEWEESDHEQPARKSIATENGPKDISESNVIGKSPSPEFEDVEIPQQQTSNEDMQLEQPSREEETVTLSTPVSVPATGMADQNLRAEAGEDEFGYDSDSDDEELMHQLAVEAEEHARFASTLNHKPQQQNVDDYERELKQLRSQQKKDRRDADEVTHVMIQECQQLLKLFGLPYITAPMEAEAQCAELVRLGLVDGIVTDDSDCFLFGGTRIYKNMFNQAKYVECYLTSDLEKEFDLTRKKLIGIAHLLGSDYTEGLPGVGPVTALEILSEFPSLNDFRQWWEGVQMNSIPKSVDAGNPFRKKFRRNASKLFLPPSFPDQRVDTAYLQPEVDDDPSEFQWGVPNLDALRSFLMATIGWSSERTDEVLVPVIKDMNLRMDEGTQANITSFFGGTTGAGYAPRKKVEQGSKRMGSALERMAQKAKRKRKGNDVADATDASEVPETADAGPPASKKRAKTRSGKAAATVAAEAEE